MNIKVNFTSKLSKAKTVNEIVFVKNKKINNKNLNSILKSVLDNELFQERLFAQREYKNFLIYFFLNNHKALIKCFHNRMGLTYF